MNDENLDPRLKRAPIGSCPGKEKLVVKMIPSSLMPSPEIDVNDTRRHDPHGTPVLRVGQRRVLK